MNKNFLLVHKDTGLVENLIVLDADVQADPKIAFAPPAGFILVDAEGGPGYTWDGHKANPPAKGDLDANV